MANVFEISKIIQKDIKQEISNKQLVPDNELQPGEMVTWIDDFNNTINFKIKSKNGTVQVQSVHLGTINHMYSFIQVQ